MRKQDEDRWNLRDVAEVGVIVEVYNLINLSSYSKEDKVDSTLDMKHHRGELIRSWETEDGRGSRKSGRARHDSVVQG